MLLAATHQAPPDSERIDGKRCVRSLDSIAPASGTPRAAAGSPAAGLAEGSADRQLNHEHSIFLDLRTASQLSLKFIILFERKDERRNTDKIVHIRDYAADGIGAPVT
jgi:hypothetical protein